jgi:hypothetical protein
MAIFLRYGAQDGNPRLGLFRDRTIYADGPTTGVAGPTANDHLCYSCSCLSLRNLVALKASVRLYLPPVRLPPRPKGRLRLPLIPSVPPRSKPRGRYPPIPRVEPPPIPPVRPCALCTLCGTADVGDLITDKEALKECTIKRKTLQTAIGISSRPPETEFEQLAVTLSSGRPRTIRVAAEYGKEVKDFAAHSSVF